MKKILAFGICLFAAVLLFAQPQGGRPDDGQRKKEWERIQSEKIAFITQELDLSPEEAQRFWPVYNQCWKETLAAHKEMRDAFGEFRGRKTDELSEAELEKKLNAYIEASAASNQMLAKWYPKFKEVLPIRKVAKLYQAEEAFQQRMINNLRKHPQQKPPQGSVFREGRDTDKK